VDHVKLFVKYVIRCGAGLGVFWLVVCSLMWSCWIGVVTLWR